MSSGCSARNASSGGGLVEFVKLDTAKVADREPPRSVDENILGLNVAVRSDPAKIGQLGVGSGDEVVGGWVLRAVEVPVAHHVREAFDEMSEEARLDGRVGVDRLQPKKEIAIGVKLGNDDRHTVGFVSDDLPAWNRQLLEAWTSSESNVILIARFCVSNHISEFAALTDGENSLHVRVTAILGLFVEPRCLLVQL